MIKRPKLALAFPSTICSLLAASRINQMSAGRPGGICIAVIKEGVPLDIAALGADEVIIVQPTDPDQIAELKEAVNSFAPFSKKESGLGEHSSNHTSTAFYMSLPRYRRERR